MKVCFTGAHSTGKTALLNYFKMNYFPQDAYYITEVARKIIQRGFDLGKNASSESYFNFINDQLFEEDKARNKSLVISDRSIIDTVGYAKANLDGGYSKVQNYVVQALERIWKIQKNYYDLYVFFPIEFGIVDDGFRDLEIEYQKNVSNAILTLLQNNNVNYIELTGTIESRYQKFVNILKSSNIML